MTFGSVWGFAWGWILWTYVVVAVMGSLFSAGIFINGLWKHTKQPHQEVENINTKYDIKGCVFEPGNHNFTEDKPITNTRKK